MPPSRARTSEALFNKFKKLYKTQKGTGEPNCPDDVRRAKRIHRDIESRQSVSDLSIPDDEDVVIFFPENEDVALFLRNLTCLQ